MKNMIAVLVAASLVACGGAPQSRSPAAPERNEMSKPSAGPKPSAGSAACPLLVSFGSYAMGIDGETLRRVEQLLGADPAVTDVVRTGGGREGELTLCASVGSAADRDRLFEAIRALFPRRPRGPLSVQTDSGRIFEANNAT